MKRWHALGVSRPTQITWLTAGVLALIAGLSGLADPAYATSDLGKNLGQEISSWGKWLLLGVACLVGLPAMLRRDMPGVLVLAFMVVVVGGFVFAPGAVEDTIVDLWRSVRGK